MNATFLIVFSTAGVLGIGFAVLLLGSAYYVYNEVSKECEKEFQKKAQIKRLLEEQEIIKQRLEEQRKQKEQVKKISVPPMKTPDMVQQTIKEQPKKLPVDLDLIKYVPENKLGEVVNSLSLKYGIGAAVIWAAIHEARKNDSPAVSSDDKVYREDFYGDDRNRDVYLNDFEPDELDDDERDEYFDDMDDFMNDDDDDDSYDSHDSWSSSDSWSSHDSFDSHDDFGHDDYGHDSWGGDDY